MKHDAWFGFIIGFLLGVTLILAFLLTIESGCLAT